MDAPGTATNNGAPPPSDGRGALLFYCAPDGSVHLEVRLERETIWLTQQQLSSLFATERSVISKHLGNIFKSGELERMAVCAVFAHTAPDGKVYQVKHYDLDAIISVGYRVNSKRGTQFRMWATRVLRHHLIEGYSVNVQRLRDLRQSIQLIGQALGHEDLDSDQARGLLRVVSDYSRALDILDDYDHQRGSKASVREIQAKALSYEEASGVIDRMKRQFGEFPLFGLEKDQSLHSSLNAIMQSFDGADVYPSLEEKAAHLLYFLVKNHSFVDGNKRIGAALFLCFMEKNRMLYRTDGSKRIADNALVAITLMIAESDPRQKSVLTQIITCLLDEDN